MNEKILIELSRDELRSIIIEVVSNCIGQSKPVAEKFLTINQAAEYLHLALPTVYAMVHRREIVFHKRGKRLYFLESDLQNFIKEGRRKSIAEIQTQL
jgi:excisionase family DNA binding protein